MHATSTASDWTAAWQAAGGLTLTSWAARPKLLADMTTARLLELALELVVVRHRLVLHAYVILPETLHVVAGRAASSDPAPALAWPSALGRVKGAFSRWRNEMHGESGALWREAVRVRPLGVGSLHDAVERCHAAPVKLGLADSPGAWRFSSWRHVYLQPTPGFVRPVPLERPIP